MYRLLCRVRDLIWGTGEPWSAVRERGIQRFMFRAALGFACGLAVAVEGVNAAFRLGAFRPPTSLGIIGARLAFDFVVQFCLGLGVARWMWTQFDRQWVAREIRRSMAERAAL